MSKIKNFLKAGVLAAFAAVVLASPTFAVDCNAVVGDGKKYDEISNTQGDPYNVTCNSFTFDNVTYQFYGKSRAACATAGMIASDPEDMCSDNSQGGLEEIVRTIINTVIFIVGILAVIMIILGGISYATSQGDSAKVKKGKDTILYGIVGLVICLLSYAIVQFVLNAINN